MTEILLIAAAAFFLLKGKGTTTSTAPTAPSTSAGDLLRQAFTTKPVSAATPTPAPAPTLVQQPATVSVGPYVAAVPTTAPKAADITIIGGTEYDQGPAPTLKGEELANWQAVQPAMQTLFAGWGQKR